MDQSIRQPVGVSVDLELRQICLAGNAIDRSRGSIHVKVCGMAKVCELIGYCRYIPLR